MNSGYASPMGMTREMDWTNSVLWSLTAGKKYSTVYMVSTLGISTAGLPCWVT